jgi:CcmD family protein
MNPYLCAAYIATWTIHFTYFGILARRYSRLHREMEKLRPPDANPKP